MTNHNQIIPGAYNPRSQNIDFEEYPGIFDPTQVPSFPGDTHHPPLPQQAAYSHPQEQAAIPSPPLPRYSPPALISQSQAMVVPIVIELTIKLNVVSEQR